MPRPCRGLAHVIQAWRTESAQGQLLVHSAHEQAVQLRVARTLEWDNVGQGQFMRKGWWGVGYLGSASFQALPTQMSIVP